MFLPFLTITVLVASVAADSVSTYSQQKCRTKLNTWQGQGGTTTKTFIQTFTKTLRPVITPTSTFTPGQSTLLSTTTITQTSTTSLPQTTDTFSSTLSFTDTSTVSTTLVSTILSTTTVTTTSTLDTTTVAASAGFTPIWSALSSSGHAASKKVKRGSVIRDAEPGAQPEAEANARFGYKKQTGNGPKITCNPDGSLTYNPPQYRGSVTCYKQVQVVTTKLLPTTAMTTKTVTAPRLTTTVYSTSTAETTTTITPIAASTTLTVSITTTLTSTTTFSSTTSGLLTTTTAVLAPQPTYYAACASNNVASFVDSNRINTIATEDPDNGFSFGNSTTTAYDCCVQCVVNGNCGGSTFHPASGTCYFFPLVGATCSGSTDVGSFTTQTGTKVGFQVSDGNCGAVVLAS
ncbi:Hypothetical predicted protein [Lecanosticta acicola]|uniref:Apple domain-containing protein n=1 Tax=Lecanosticta acicola TaxID=111012 RepID=A0AAI9EER8_9PEZI|nr:Hypothetical predicted protein [Lecanosticta acicola]